MVFSYLGTKNTICLSNICYPINIGILDWKDDSSEQVKKFFSVTGSRKYYTVSPSSPVEAAAAAAPALAPASSENLTRLDSWSSASSLGRLSPASEGIKINFEYIFL